MVFIVRWSYYRGEIQNNSRKQVCGCVVLIMRLILGSFCKIGLPGQNQYHVPQGRVESTKKVFSKIPSPDRHRLTTSGLAVCSCNLYNTDTYWATGCAKKAKMQTVLVCPCSTSKLCWTFTPCHTSLRHFAGPARHGEVIDGTVQVASYLILLLSLLILNF